MNVIANSNSRTPAGKTARSDSNVPIRILVVEDDVDIRRLNAKVLTASGYHVEAAEDGSIAWDNLQQKSYDLVVTDNDMPKVSGVELLKKLYAAHMALPGIMATGQLPQDEFTRQPWLHPAAMILKPYTSVEFLEKVQEVLHTTGCDPRQIAPPLRFEF